MCNLKGKGCPERQQQNNHEVLNEKPTASFALIKPDTINNAPTRIRAMLLNLYIGF